MPKTKKEKHPKEQLREYLKGDSYKEYVKILKSVEIESVKKPFETLSSKNKPKLRTNTVLDDLLGVGGGIKAGKLVEFYGGYGSGKTQSIFALIAEATQDGYVVLIDAEYTWEPERQMQICKARGLDPEKLVKNFDLIQPEGYEEQLAKILTLPSPMDLELMGLPPLKLVAVDSLLALLNDSRDFMGLAKLNLRSKIIRDMLHALRDVAKTHNCIVVFTNQIYNAMNVAPNTPLWKREIGSGGPTVFHRPDIRLFFRRTTDPIRIARLMDSSELPAGERVFQINEKGIDDVAEKAAWMKKLEKVKQESPEEPSVEVENEVKGEEVKGKEIKGEAIEAEE